MIELTATHQKQLDRLTEEQRQLFLCSGVFAPDGAFTAEALLKVWSSNSEVDSLSSVLDALTPDFLIQDGDWYQHANLKLHAYALEQLTALGHAAEAHRQHLLYYQHCGENWVLPAEDRSRLHHEVTQYRHAFDWARLNAYDYVINFILAGCQHLAAYPEYHGDIQSWLETAHQLIQTHDENWVHAGQLRALGDVSLRVKHLDLAQTFYYMALQLYGNTSTAGQAHTFKGLGDWAIVQGKLELARDHYYKALILYEVADFALGQANTLKQLAELCERQGDLKTAREYYNRAIKLFRELNFELELANSHKALGDLYTRQGDYDRAQTEYEEAFGLYNDIEFWVEQAHILLAVGDLHIRKEDFEGARERYTRALPIFQKMGERKGQAQTYRAFGNASLAAKDFADARHQFDHALKLYQQFDAYDEMATLYHVLAHLYLDDGQIAAAIGMIAAAVPILDKLDDHLHRHEVQVGLRRVVLAMGDDFANYWGEMPLPDWLIEIPPSDTDTLPLDELSLALESRDNLREALLENTTLTLHYLGLMTPDERGEWLNKAYKLCDSQAPDSCLQRALILKERASLPNQQVSETLHAAIAEYDTALAQLEDQPQAYAHAQNKRVALLRDMAGMQGEKRGDLLRLSLEGCNAALAKLDRFPEDYAYTQLHRAHLLRELAGLKGEDRAHWMNQALDAFDQVLALLEDAPLQQATAQTNRASLLLEVAVLVNEDAATRLKQALAAATTAVQITDQHTTAAQYQRIAHRMLGNVHQMIVGTFDTGTFDRWWGELVGKPQPDWSA